MSRFLCLGLLLSLLALANSQQGGGDPEDPTNPHRDPSKCEVCKLMAIELQGMMEDTGKSREVLELGYRIDQKHKRIPYKFSELRLIESLEGVCERIMKYNIHAERESSRRFAKGQSETFSTLHGLVNKGVKVELGIPYDMWDEPSAPVHTLKKLCDQIVEEHEEAIESWFRGDQKKTLTNYLCAERALTREQAECLTEEWTGKERVVHDTGENKDEEETSKEEEEESEEDDPEKKKEAELDRKKVQKEIERQAKEQQNQQQNQQVKDEERERNQERDRKKREREMERRRREREDRDGDRKMDRERGDRSKVEREIQRQAEREKRMREKHGDDHFEKRRRDRDREREEERERRRGGRGRHDYHDDMDRYMDEELADLRRGHHFDSEEYVDRIMERERRKREDRIRGYKNEL